MVQMEFKHRQWPTTQGFHRMNSHLFLADSGRVRFCITDPGIAEGLALVPGAYARRASRTALQPAGLMAADGADSAPLSDLKVLQCQHCTVLSVAALVCCGDRSI